MGVPCLSVPTTIFSMSCDALGVAPAADHVLRAAELDQPPAHVVVAVPDRLDHGGDRDVEGQQLGGIEVDLVLLLKSADGGHLGHAGHRLELVAEIPVLEAPQLGQVVLAGLVHQGVLIDPADARGVRAQFRADAFRQSGKDFREVFQRAAARPVEVGPVLEDHVDVGEAEVGEAADGLDLRRSEHGRDDRIGDLVLDDVGASVPAGVDDDLRIGEIGNRVQRHLTHPVEAPTMATSVKMITRYLLRALNSMMRSIMAWFRLSGLS